MKKIIMFLIPVILIACGGQQTNENSNESGKLDSTAFTEYTIMVEGMTCGGCEKTVQAAIMEIPGAVFVKASHEQASVQVKFDSLKTNMAKLKEVIDSKGYQSGAFQKIN